MSAHAGPLPPLAPREAYALWAPTYDAENVVSRLDEEAAARLTPPLAGRDLLDAACGTARRLAFAPGEGPRRALGVDLVPEMLARGRSRLGPARALAAGDALRLPVASARFDVLWCRLAAGHVADLAALYAELARVARPGAALVLTDFHPEAARRGHARRFVGPDGRAHAVAHVVHEAADHARAARAAGWRADGALEPGIGPSVRGFYEEAGALSRYARDLGMPALLALAWRLRPAGREAAGA